ncbi:transcription elongation factor GreA [Lactococcus garvieae]
MKNGRKTFPMTKEGLEKLEQELDNLKLVKRPEVIERIKIARSYGDLSENSEYEAAKDEQAFIEGRISTVETMIRYAEIVDNANIDKNEVALGKAVVFQEVGDDEEEEYEIVGTAEADPFSGKISNESPIAQALIGRKVGDVVKIPLPMGEIEVKIVDVK